MRVLLVFWRSVREMQGIRNGMTPRKKPSLEVLQLLLSWWFGLDGKGVGG